MLVASGNFVDKEDFQERGAVPMIAARQDQEFGKRRGAPAKLEPLEHADQVGGSRRW